VNFKIVGIGELLWDILPAGPQLGGAPGNFAYHAHALGADALLISRVGEDDLGHRALHQLEKLGLPADCVEIDPKLPTGSVTVRILEGGQPHYEIHENVAWDALRGESAARHAVAGADAVCFGSLAQRNEPSRTTIRSLLAAAPRAALRIFDINLRQNYFSTAVIQESLNLSNALKVNDTELPVLADMFHLNGDVRSQITELAHRWQLRCVAYTRGGHGSLLFSKGKFSDHPGFPSKVIDTIGAGDAFTAAMTIGLLAGWDLDRVNENANRIAAYVCSCAGATPVLPEKLRGPFLTLNLA